MNPTRRPSIAAAAFVLALVLSLAACDDDSGPTGPEVEIDPNDIIANDIAAGGDAVVTTGSGLQYLEVEEGTGLEAEPGDSVFVNYRGQFVNGVEFDNSYSRGNPISFVIGIPSIIPGFAEGASLMREGGTSKVLLPPELAYGADGRSGIPPNTTLYFDMELVEVRPGMPTDSDNFIAETLEEQASDVITTESGLQYLRVTEGTGEQAMTDDTVSVNFRGQFANGVEFAATSFDGEDPLTFVVGSDILPGSGFSEGVALLREGGRAKFFLPSELAYGERGSGGGIPPDTPLYFEIELVNVR